MYEQGRKDEAALRRMLSSIDHRGYPAYKSLAGSYDFGNYILSIDHVQGDPFASPSAVSIHVPGKKAGFPERMYQSYENRRAFQDHLLRLFEGEVSRSSRRAGSGKSGMISCSRPGQEVLDRSACQVDPRSGDVVLRFYVGFPAAGRTILADELSKILFGILPACAGKSLYWGSLDQRKLQAAVALAEDQTALRAEMEKNGLIAFIADGAVLPRESGVSQKPMAGAVPFRSPDEDAVEFTLPHRGRIRGMGIPKGITLIIGGGYHGKSTLLKALERGVYDHIAGDGREFVLTDDTAVKIRAEDGRSVSNDDISMFIRNLPSGKDTSSFSTLDASGSTSQAASVSEAVESGAGVLLMDEDTCATNFMVRDELMQRIVSASEEPIVPFSRTMRPLYRQCGISTILVAGSSGAFFGAANRIIQMDRYRAKDVTARVRSIAALQADTDGEARSDRDRENVPGEDGAEKTGIPKNGSRMKEKEDDRYGLAWDFSLRKPSAGPQFSGRDGRVKVRSLGRDGFMINHETVDLRAVEQIADPEQSECLAQMLVLLSGDMRGQKPLQELLGDLSERIRRQGISAAVQGRLPGNLALPRIQELYAAIDRCRAVRM